MNKKLLSQITVIAMTDNISVPRDLLIDVRDSTNEAGNLSYRQHHIDHHRRLTRKLDELLEAPAAEVEGLEVIGFHCMDSAGIETLELRGGSYADEPLCSLPKAQAVIDKQAARIAEMEREICYLMGEINGENHE